jgi:hypothetical protein
MGKATSSGDAKAHLGAPTPTPPSGEGVAAAVSPPIAVTPRSKPRLSQFVDRYRDLRVDDRLGLLADLTDVEGDLNALADIGPKQGADMGWTVPLTASREEAERRLRILQARLSGASDSSAETALRQLLQQLGALLEVLASMPVDGDLGITTSDAETA